MLDKMFAGPPWLALVLATLVVGLDVGLTILERSLYYGGAKEVISVDGQQFRLDHPYQVYAGWRQFWTRRYTLYLICTPLGVLMTWFVFTRWNNKPDVFAFAMGGLLLFEFVEISRLLHSVNLLRYARQRRGIKGKVEVQNWVVWNLAVVNDYSFGLVFLLAFLASSSWFFLGGTAACFILGHGLRDRVASMRRARLSGSRY